jgi:hypothetical protein
VQLADTPFRLLAVREMDKRRRSPNPASSALASVRTFAHPELVGAKLDTSRLSEEEGTELKELVSRKLAVSYGDPGAQELTAKETARYERLIGVAADDPKPFGRKRKEAEDKARVAVAKEELRLAAVPPRPEWAEPGSISLPKFIFGWLQDRRGGFTVADLGMLAALLYQFENRAPLFPQARFEQVDGEPVLVLREEHLRFPSSMNNDPLLSGHSGYVRERMALQTLTRNGWFTLDRSGGELRVRLGERGKKLREGKAPTTEEGR